MTLAFRMDAVVPRRIEPHREIELTHRRVVTVGSEGVEVAHALVPRALVEMAVEWCDIQQ